MFKMISNTSILFLGMVVMYWSILGITVALENVFSWVF